MLLTIAIQINQTIELEYGLKIRFDHHSHKTALKEGVKSPLIIYMSYEYQGNTYEYLEHNSFPNNRHPWGWEWKELRFTVLEYEYNESMTLNVSWSQDNEI